MTTPILANKYKILGFLYSCLCNFTATEEEVLEAIHILIANCTDDEMLEHYIDLLENDGTRLNLMAQFKKINHFKWLPSLTDSQDNALIGITSKRGVAVPYDYTQSYENDMKSALDKHPEIEELFREVFPFIKF